MDITETETTEIMNGGKQMQLGIKIANFEYFRNCLSFNFIFRHSHNKTRRHQRSDNSRNWSSYSMKQRDEFDEQYYPISQYGTNGFAIIFDIFEFFGKPDWRRNGTRIDCNELRKMFLQLKIIPIIYQESKDCTKSKILEHLTDFATDSRHKDFNVAFICFLTHGNRNGIYTADCKTLNMENEVYPLLNNKNSPILRDKPKVFITQVIYLKAKLLYLNAPNDSILQACRGNLLDEGVDCKPSFGKSQYICHADSPPITIEPKLKSSYSDIFIVSSSLPLFKAFRSEETGSSFIQTLCRVFREDARRYDLTTMVQKVFDLLDSEVTLFRDSDGEIKEVKSVPHIQMYGKHKKLFFGRRSRL